MSNKHTTQTLIAILFHQLGEVGKQWMMFPKEIKLVAPLFLLHQPLQE